MRIENSKNAKDKKFLFWKIVVEPVKPNPLDIVLGKLGKLGEPWIKKNIKIVKQVSLWEPPGGSSNSSHWVREKYQEIPLAIKKLQGVEVKYDGIHFTEGFLEASDPGLNAVLDEWGFSLVVATAVPSEATTQTRRGIGGNEYEIELYGRNIQIEVDAKIYDGIQRTQPIFWFPQPGGHILLAVEVAGNTTHHTSWEISNSEYQTDPYSLSDFHTIIVSQDKDRNIRALGLTYFEFFTDSLQNKLDVYPAGLRPGQTIDGHLFEPDENRFYIGRCPQSVNSQGNVTGCFTGIIRRLVFDPNASCLGCA